MKRTSIGGLSLWQFEHFEKEPSIKHFVSDRDSLPGKKEFTLSFSSSPDKREIQHNRELLASAMGIPSDQLFFPTQVHDTRVVHVHGQTSEEELANTDALMTNEQGLCLSVMSADCVTILLYDKKNKAIGAVHSGWRGTVARILEKVLLEMQAKFGTKGDDLAAGIGPSVCQESYEVGEEVVMAVQRAFGKESGLMVPQQGNKAKLDLWRANKLQLKEFGVRETQIEISDLCTVKNNNYFFSARKGDTGRFGAGIMLV